VVAEGISYRLIVDASPLIYLAKLDALDVFTRDEPAAISDGVRDEVLLPQAAYRFPEIVRIDEAVREGCIKVLSLKKREREAVDALSARVPGLGRGELETIAVARARRWSAAIADRRASLVAQAHGVPVIGMVELLFARTTDGDQLARRIRGLAKLVNMRIETLEQLLGKVDERTRR
jgi:predicted nucleic acid-binding protein